MTGKFVELLPSAGDMRQKLIRIAEEKATAERRDHEAARAERQALIKQLGKPVPGFEEDAIKRALDIIDRAVSAALKEVEVFRFPNDLCTDHGRAINNAEPGWPETLTGIPKDIYALWEKYFRHLGYRLKVYIVDFPGGMPGDVAMVLSWG